MGEFLTRISGQIVGPIVLGTLFPVVLFFILLSFMVFPLTPYGRNFTDLVRNPQLWQDKGASALVAIALVLLLTVILYHLNIPLTRLYEGYLWENSWLGRVLKWCKRRKFDRLQQIRDRARALRREVAIANVEVPLDAVIDYENEAAHALNNAFPSERDLILPTRLGNVVRAFETYTKGQYKADLIILWPRLQGVLDPTYVQALDGAKTAFDFMLNCSFLGGMLALILVAAGLYWHHPTLYGWHQLWELWAIILILGSWLAYLGAVSRAEEWGLGVKAAFDLFRWPLLQKLGYQVKPENITEERKLWSAISDQFLLPGDPRYPDILYQPVPTTLVVEPTNVKVSFKRIVSVIDENISEIRIVIFNIDSAGLDADQVFLRDDIPVGKVYVRDSATLNGAGVPLHDVAPLKMQIGPLPYYETRTVTYRVRLERKA